MSRWSSLAMSMGRMQTLSSPGLNHRPATRAWSSPVTSVSSKVNPRTPSALWAVFPVFYFDVRFGLIAVPTTRRDRGGDRPKLLRAYSRTESSIGFHALLRIRMPS